MSEEDPIRRWLQRQQDENWLEVKAVLGGMTAIFLASLFLYWTDAPL